MILKIDGKDYSTSSQGEAIRSPHKRCLDLLLLHVGRNLPRGRIGLQGRGHHQLMPMSPEELSELVASVENCDQATYHDTKTDADVTKKVIVTLSPAKLVINAADKRIWSDSESGGMTLTIEER